MCDTLQGKIRTVHILQYIFNTIVCWVGTILSEECTASILKAKSAGLGSGLLYKGE